MVSARGILVLVLPFVAATPVKVVSAAELAPKERSLGVWAIGTRSGGLVQLKNSSWSGMIDTIYLNECGFNVTTNKTTQLPELQVDEAQWNSKNCTEIMRAAAEEDISVQIWLGGVPYSVSGGGPQNITDSEKAATNLIDSVVAAATKYVGYGVRGFHWDEETECAPRANLQDYKLWSAFMDRLADALHTNVSSTFETTVAVQSMFGIEAGKYVSNYPCSKAPWTYKAATDPSSYDEMRSLIANSKIDRFLVMDTYYFSLMRYLDALDWYVGNFPAAKLTIAVANTNVNDNLKTTEDFVARIHALDKHDSVTSLNIFALPVDDAWRLWVRRWKNRCAGCPALGCFDPAVSCTAPSNGHSGDIDVVFA
eukprot:TRINITY_DN41555_c0_g2_i2.p1 TRINITY_DN41555_c0_g2~~TRINITY_DN41555_c0_g2_i2.p1  ORF type:complete len:387 (+),score=46.92 TRINITY_DN41555_c0_g2_i2:63-1163(+)